VVRAPETKGQDMLWVPITQARETLFNKLNALLEGARQTRNAELIAEGGRTGARTYHSVENFLQKNFASKTGKTTGPYHTQYLNLIRGRATKAIRTKT